MGISTTSTSPCPHKCFRFNIQVPSESMGARTEDEELPSEQESHSQTRLWLLLLVKPRPARLKSAQGPVRLVLDRVVPSVVDLGQSTMSSRVSTALPELAQVPIAVPPPFGVSPLLACCHHPYQSSVRRFLSRATARCHSANVRLT